MARMRSKGGEVTQPTLRQGSRTPDKLAVQSRRGLTGAAGLGQDKGLSSPGLTEEVTEALLLKRLVSLRDTVLNSISLPCKCQSISRHAFSTEGMIFKVL